jgi:hypothetical protein
VTLSNILKKSYLTLSFIVQVQVHTIFLMRLEFPCSVIIGGVFSDLVQLSKVQVRQVVRDGPRLDTTNR